MKPTLQLTLGQRLAMTPQLQQAIRLLPLSAMALQQQVQEMLATNPMLEEDATVPSGEQDTKTAANESLLDFSEPAVADQPAEEPAWSEQIPVELPLDTQWEVIYSSLPVAPDSHQDCYAYTRAVDSLQDHLEWQLDMASMSDRDRTIGLTIIDAVNADGYLTSTLAELSHTLAQRITGLEPTEVQVLQHRIQQFDPVGCASFNLAECLQAQLAQLPPATPHIASAKQLLDRHLDALGRHDYTAILKASKWSETQLIAALQLIRCLNPRPGAAMGPAESGYVVPDVLVTSYQCHWQVELNPEALPHLRINKQYAPLVQRANLSRDNLFMQQQLQEARWFLKNIRDRNATLLKVARQIMAHQHDFLTQGPGALRPLLRADIATAVGVHESTVSRVTTQKYVYTPKGVYPLTFFFTNAVGTAAGTEHAATAIRARIKQLVAEENTRRPLSDSKITHLLSHQGIHVARRTVAKYREALKIPPSHERKQFA